MSELYPDFTDRLRGDRWQPAMDVFETDDAVVVRLEIAGVRGEDLKVQVDGELLRVSGVRRVPTSPKARRLHRMELAFDRMTRIGSKAAQVLFVRFMGYFVWHFTIWRYFVSTI